VPPLTSTPTLPLPVLLPPPGQAFHAGGKEAVRDVVYNEVAARLRCPIVVRASDPAGGEATYGGTEPGQAVYLVKDDKDLFVRVHADGSPFAPPAPAARDDGGGYGGAGGAARPRKPRPAGPGGGGGGGGGQTARDKERDATWEAKYQNLLSFVRTHGHRPRRTGEDRERQVRGVGWGRGGQDLPVDQPLAQSCSGHACPRPPPRRAPHPRPLNPRPCPTQMCFWLAQQQRKMKDGALNDDKRDKLAVVLAVKGPAARAGGGGYGGYGGAGGSDAGDDGFDGGDDYDQAGYDDGGGDDDMGGGFGGPAPGLGA
jgi:hypothetical protein